MLKTRTTAGTVVTFAAAALVLTLFASAPTLADHLDRWETRQIVRHLEERNDALQDRISDWVGQRREDREHRAEEMLRDAEHFDVTLAQFKIDLYHHDDPWDLRDNAHEMIDTAAEFGRSISRGEWHGELRREWEDMRDSVNELARHFRLSEIDR